MKSYKRKANNGLTLVEVLIASALVVLIAVPLNAMLTTVINSWHTIPDRTQMEREARLTIDVMKTKIQSADSVFIADHDPLDTDSTVDLIINQGEFTFDQENEYFKLIKVDGTEEILSKQCSQFEIFTPGDDSGGASVNFILIRLALGCVHEVFGFSRRTTM